MIAQTILDEINYTFEKIKIVSNNESPFNYIRGFFNNENISVNFKFMEFPILKMKLDELLNLHDDCVLGYSFLFEWSLAEKNVIACQDICDLLANKLDIIRKKYWQWKRSKLISIK